MKWWRKSAAQLEQESRANEWELIGLAMQVTYAKPLPGHPYLEGNNDGIELVQSYIHGRCLGSPEHAERRLLLELRRDIDKFKIQNVDEDDE